MGSIADNRCSKCGAYTKDVICDTCAARPAASQALVEYQLLNQGIQTYRPSRENDQHDLVAYIGHKLARVQVKTAYFEKGGGVTANVCRTTSKGRIQYRPHEVDYFAVVWDEQVYLIPYSAVKGKGRINVLAQKYRRWRLSPVGGASDNRDGDSLPDVS